MDEDLDCIYEGLDEPVIAVDNEKLRHENYLLMTKNKSLEQALDAANSEKEVLAKNISVLYNTAKLEMVRKDRMIKELRNQVEKIPFQSQRARSERFNNYQQHENSENDDYSKKNEFDRIKRFNENSRKARLDDKKSNSDKQNLRRSREKSPHRSRTNRKRSRSRDRGRKRYDRSPSSKRHKSNTPTNSRRSRQSDFSNSDRKFSSSRQDYGRRSGDNKRNNSSNIIYDRVGEDARIEDCKSPVTDGRNDNFGMSFMTSKSKEIKHSNITSESNNIDCDKKNRKKIDLKDYRCRKNTNDKNNTEKFKDILHTKESQDEINKNCNEKSRKTKDNKIVEIVEIIVNQNDIKEDLELKDNKAEIDKDYDNTIEIGELVEDIKNDNNESDKEKIREENNESIISESFENIFDTDMDIISDKTSEIIGDERNDITVGDYHITMDSNQETENMQIQDEDNIEHENNKMHLFNGSNSIQCKVETNLEIENHDQQGDAENHTKTKEDIDEVELVYKMGSAPETKIQCELPRNRCVTKKRRLVRIKMENNITFVGKNSEVNNVQSNTDISSKDNNETTVETNVSSETNDQSLLVEFKTEDMETDEQRKEILETEIKEQEEKKNGLEEKEVELLEQNVELKTKNDNEISTSDNLITNVNNEEPIKVKEEIKTECNSVIIISTSKVVRSKRRYVFKKSI